MNQIEAGVDQSAVQVKDQKLEGARIELAVEVNQLMPLAAELAEAAEKTNTANPIVTPVYSEHPQKIYNRNPVGG
jgi:hypothetical protein